MDRRCEFCQFARSPLPISSRRNSAVSQRRLMVCRLAPHPFPASNCFPLFRPMPSRVSRLPHTSFAWLKGNRNDCYAGYLLLGNAGLFEGVSLFIVWSSDLGRPGEAGKSCRVLAPSTLARQDPLPLKKIYGTNDPYGS